MRMAFTHSEPIGGHAIGDADAASVPGRRNGRRR